MVYDITSRKNELVQRFKKLAADGSYRRERREYLCDGVKLLEEAVKWGAPLRDVLTCRELDIPLSAGARLITGTREVLEAASPMRTPQDVVFTVAMPEPEAFGDIAGAIVLENIQDPGNVGTVLRTANAFDIPAVVLVGACADLYSPKTARAAMGALFRQRVTEMSYDRLAAAAEATPLYGAALGMDSADIREIDLAGAAVAVGNEGSGLTDRLLSMCRGTVVIPMSPKCESLNAAVAASVIMWERARTALPGVRP